VTVPESLTLCNLASGSRGNATFVGQAGRGMLVDVGVSARQAALRLRARGLEPDAVEALLISHEHRDHSSGVRVYARRHGATVYVHEEVRERVDLRGVSHIETFGDEPFEAAGLQVRTFTIPHDTVRPVAFVVGNDGAQVGIATDMGTATQLVAQRLRECQAVLLEFNHDLQMLMEGPYTWPLKQRVRGRLGHLSNDDALSLMETILAGRVKILLAGHLSQENNRPELVRGLVLDRLAQLGRSDVEFAVLDQNEPGPVFEVAPEPSPVSPADGDALGAQT